MEQIMSQAHEFLRNFCLSNPQNQALLHKHLDLFLTPGVSLLISCFLARGSIGQSPCYLPYGQGLILRSWFHPVFCATTRLQRERRLKSEFAFFQSLSQLFLPTYFIKYRRTLLELNSEGPYPSLQREITFRRCLFKYSIKREIRHFHVVVVQKRVKKCTNERDARAKLLCWL